MHYFIMEKSNGKTLESVTKAFKSPGSVEAQDATMKKLLTEYGAQNSVRREKFVSKFLKQVGGNGILLMNKLGISHHDIKPPNIMVEIKHGELYFTVIDLGFVSFYKHFDSNYDEEIRKYVTNTQAKFHSKGSTGFESECQTQANKAILSNPSVAFMMDIPVFMQVSYMLWDASQPDDYTLKGRWWPLYQFISINKADTKKVRLNAFFQEIGNDRLKKLFREHFPLDCESVDPVRLEADIEEIKSSACVKWKEGCGWIFWRGWYSFEETAKDCCQDQIVVSSTTGYYCQCFGDAWFSPNDCIWCK